jgi:hypothetical protein
MQPHPPADAPPAQAASQASSQGTPAKIAGTWKLNKDQSDDPRKAMQSAGMSGPGGGRGGMGGGGGMGGRGRGGYGGRGGGMMNEYNELTIAQSGTAVKISGSSGRVLAQSPTPSDNSKSSEASASAPSGEWQDNKYVVTTQDERGGKTMRTYALSQDGSQLMVATRIDNARFNQPVTFRFVYDPVKSSGGQ